MNARFKAWIEAIGDQFWVRPAIVVLVCIGLAEGAVWIDHAGVFSAWRSSASSWGYSGGAEGARVLLGAVASSSIGVASTSFSITIAALSLASGQMGPRLLRNFIRDSRNQLALGIFVGTFAYALIVLRTVRSQEEGAFIPHAGVTGAIILGLICVATLIWFVHHVATSINVESVVDAVHQDLIHAVEAGTSEHAGFARVSIQPGTPFAVASSGYLQAVDLSELADWVAKKGTVLSLWVRPGDYVPRGLPVGEILATADDLDEILARTLTFGRQPAAVQDIEYSVRQLTEVAVRALSPGINDPFTAGSVLERLGDALCRIANRALPNGALSRGSEIVLLHTVTDYDGLCDAMFHPIRQNGLDSAYVLIRLIDVLSKVAAVERMSNRSQNLLKHADLCLAAGRSNLREEASIAALVQRYQNFRGVLEGRVDHPDVLSSEASERRSPLALKDDSAEESR